MLESLAVTFDRLERGKAATAPIVTGSRGLGKTVLLNEFVRVARTRGWFTAFDEVSPATSLPKLVAVLAREVLLEMSSKRRFQERVQRAMGVLKAFTAVKAFGIELQIDAVSVPGPADTGDLSRDLRGLFCELGALGRDHGVGVLFALDEIHALSEDELFGLTAALHRTAQDELPVAFVSSGLFPSWQANGDERRAPSMPSARRRPESYPMRIFAASYHRLAPLSEEDARRALADPALAENVTYAPDALTEAVKYCEGNPWLLQLVGASAWEHAAGPSIDLASVIDAEESTRPQLDEWFFPRLFQGSTDAEHAVLSTIAEIEKRGPVTFNSLLVALADTERDGVWRTVLDLAGRDLVAISSAGPDAVVTFTFPHSADYLRRDPFLRP